MSRPNKVAEMTRDLSPCPPHLKDPSSLVTARERRFFQLRINRSSVEGRKLSPYNQPLRPMFVFIWVPSTPETLRAERISSRGQSCIHFRWSIAHLLPSQRWRPDKSIRTRPKSLQRTESFILSEANHSALENMSASLLLLSAHM